jgi:Family of unknown function (DUF5716)
MPNLFDTLPHNLFQPLAAQHAALYVEALLALFAETQRQQQPVSRDLALSLVADLIERAAPEGLLDLEPLDTDEPPDGPPDPYARAAAMLRYLTRCGWLRAEMQRDFSQTFILPDYAFRLLATLQELADNEPPRLQGLICAIHDMLQMAVREGTAHVRLVEAHRQTRTLMNGLRELQHNIGAHIEQVLRQLSARAVLDQVFTTYRTDVVDRAYHQLRTTDHVSRFRPGVIAALAQLSQAELLLQSARQLRTTGGAESIELASAQLLNQIHEVREQFEGLDRMLQLIDTRHSQFVDAAVRTVELQITANTTTSGQLHALLTELITGAAGGLAEGALGPLIDLSSLGLVDPQSLAPPTRASTPFVPESAAARGPSEHDLAAARAQTLRQLRRTIGREHIRRYAARLLAERETLRGAEIAVAGPDELPLLIYLRRYGDGSLGYRVEDITDAPWVEHDGIGFRDFVLRRA